MIKVCITNRLNKMQVTSIFNSEEEASIWVNSNKLLKALELKDFDIEAFETDSNGETTKLIIKLYDPMLKLREKRNKLLCATDWLMLSDVKLDQKHRKIYVTYRQYLRDCPEGNSTERIEDFTQWIRRHHPEEFMDGGNAEDIIIRFNTYIKN